MRYGGPIILAILILLAGCLVTDRYRDMHPTIDPVTGGPVTATEDHPSPLDQGISAAAGGFASGGWQGAVAAGVPALLLALWQARRAQRHRAAAEEGAQLAEELKVVGLSGGPVTKSMTNRALDAAGARQNRRGIRTLLRKLRPAGGSSGSSGDQQDAKDAFHA